MKVYRIQSQMGYGPFQSCPSAWKMEGDYFLFDNISKSYHNDISHPVVHNDFKHLDAFKYGMPFCFKCACTDLTMLEKWFSKKMVNILSNNNFKICVFEVESKYVMMGKSKMQCVFDDTEAEKVSEMSVLELLKHG
jgi:hypothetical protein